MKELFWKLIRLRSVLQVMYVWIILNENVVVHVCVYVMYYATLQCSVIHYYIYYIHTIITLQCISKVLTTVTRLLIWCASPCPLLVNSKGVHLDFLVNPHISNSNVAVYQLSHQLINSSLCSYVSVSAN